jgi:hypothetical protein
VWQRLVLEATSSEAELSWEAMATDDVTGVFSREEITQSAPSPTDSTAVTAAAEAIGGAAEQTRVDGAHPRWTDEVDRHVAPAQSGDTVVALRLGPPMPWAPAPGATQVTASPERQAGTEVPPASPLVSQADGVLVVDPEVFGAIWVRIEAPVWLLDGDHFRLGAQLVRFETDAAGCGRLRIVTEAGVSPAVRIDRCGIILGRGAADISFDDPRLEVAHCRVRAYDEGFSLEDLGGVDGTWLQARAGDVLPHGSLVMLGETLVQLEPA